MDLLLGIMLHYTFSLIRPKKRIVFGIHDPLGRYLFQLRVGLSSLRYHKKRHNFIDSPSDKRICNQGIENTNHFLFFVSFFATRRATLANNVIAILQNYSFRKPTTPVSIWLPHR